MLRQPNIRKFTKFMKKKPQVIAVYLHGSQVKGYAGKESDTDVAVVVEDKDMIRDELRLMAEVAGELPVKNPDVRVIDRQSSPLFLFNIVRDGKLIYKRNSRKKVAFESFVLRKYYDTSYMRNIYEKYLYRSVKKEAAKYGFR